ncbi:unnamed protein product [Peniophora sp. CBMAI 1063]|nr:unnamed protein product [Peniophora sp. CBMAI 1063]
MVISLEDLTENHLGGVRGRWNSLLGIVPDRSRCRRRQRRVRDNSTDLAAAIARCAQFYKHESSKEGRGYARRIGRLIELSTQL